MTVDKEDLKALLKRLRSERKDQLTAAQQHHKVLSGLRRKVKKALAEGPQTVPALAVAVEASTDDVLWHLAAMRAYGLVAEDEQDGDYFKYRLVDDKKKGR
ncbi:MAG: hypothetical protein DRI90_03155 [Deltaproteobacteria bacterium]|nr:MAG: hypothetical protein DRI90_03155 [Deltaproteobacteria bacterium]